MKEEGKNNSKFSSITKKEFKIYEMLLKHGASTISFISKKSGVNQRNAYDYIERLIHKGLVGQVIINNKRLFLGLNPEMIGYLIEEQKNEAEEFFSNLISNSENEDVQLNIITKKSFGKISKRVEDFDLYIGKIEDRSIDPAINYLQKIAREKKRLKKMNTSAQIISIISGDFFLLYSIKEEEGFFTRNQKFTDSMRVYLDWT